MYRRIDSKNEIKKGTIRKFSRGTRRKINYGLIGTDRKFNLKKMGRFCGPLKWT